jgi:hypothetical protein
VITFQPEQVTTDIVAGLNSDPTTDQNFTGIDYAWGISSTGAALTILESGVSVLTVGTYTAATVLTIRHDGQVVQYLKDGVIARQIAAPNRTLFFDSSFFNPGALRNVNFTSVVPVPAVPFIATGACYVSNNIARIICEAPPAFSSGAVYSTQAHANGCIVSAQGEEIGSPVSSSCDFGLDQTPIAGGSLDYSWALTGSGAAIFKDLSLQANTGAITLDTILQIAYDGKFVTFIRDGVIIRQYPDPGKTFFARALMVSNGPSRGLRNLEYSPYGITTPDPFIARGNCVVSAGSIMKVGGASAWDSDVYSLVGYAQAHVQWKSTTGPSAGNRFMIGLNADPTTDQSFTSIGFAWYCDSGPARIFESGTEVGSGIGGTYTADTVWAVTFDGTNIRYLKDDVVIRTVAASGTMFMDSSFFDPGAVGCNCLEFGPSTTLPRIGTVQLTPNAATETYVSTQASFTLGPSGGLGIFQDVDSVTLPAKPVAYTAMVTYTAVMYETPTAQDGVFLITNSVGGGGSVFAGTRNLQTTPVGDRYTQRAQISVPANTAQGIAARWQTSSAGVTLFGQGGVFQVEQIKR